MFFTAISRTLLLTTVGVTVTMPVVTHAATFSVVELTVQDVQAGLSNGTFTSADLVEQSSDPHSSSML